MAMIERLDTTADALARADAAMYARKAERRNGIRDARDGMAARR